jgi:uncharacterized membrane protein
MHKKDTWAIILPILIHLAIVIPLAASLNVWIDEVHTLNTIKGPLTHTLDRAIGFEMQTPLYFIIMNFWAKLGSSIFFLRTFSILCTALSVWLASRISKSLFSEPHHGWLALAVAVNPYTIWAATEMRLYAFLVLLSAALLWTFVRGFLSDGPTAKGKRIGFFIFSVLALYTQYYAAFLLVALFIGLLVMKGWAAVKKLAGWLALTAFSALPLLVAAITQMTQHRQIIVVNNSILNYLSVGTRFLRYPLRLEWMPSMLNMLVYGVCAAGLLALMTKYRQNLRDEHLLTGTLIFVVTAFFLTAMLFVNHELVNTTHTTVLFLPSLLLPTAALSIVPSTRRRTSAIALLSAMLLANGIYMVGEYSPMAKFGDSRRVATYIAGNEESGQPILVFIAELALPLEYYYSGTNRIIPIPDKVPDTSYDLNYFALKSTQDIAMAIEREGLHPESFWVVSWGLCKYLGVDYHCEILEEFIREAFTVEDDKAFFHSRVRLIRRKAVD